MDICNSSFDKLPEKYMLGFYYPADYAPDDNYGEKEPQNPEFNCYSQMILDLKNNFEYAINNFHKKLSSILLGVKDIAITTPPTNAVGLKNLAQNLANNKEITYLSRCFGRSSKREIYLNNNHSITDKTRIILLDDIVTKGDTMELCKKELLKAGAKEVKCITLGRTWRDSEKAYYKFKEACNLKSSQENKKFFLEVADKLQKNADALRNLGDYHDEMASIAHRILNDLIEKLNESRYDLGRELCFYEEEALNVINGEDMFSPCNVLQKPFLW